MSNYNMKYEYYNIDNYVKKLDIFNNRYKIEKIIKQTTKKIIYLISDINNKLFFCKIIALDFVTDEQQKIHVLLKNTENININKILYIYKSSNFFIVIKEYIEGKSLNFYITDATLNITYIFNTLVKTINYLHELKLIHGDIKLDNIMIEQNTHELKLIDFDLVKNIQNNFMTINYTSGTTFYLSPEVVSQNLYGYKYDIWCIGIVLFLLVVFNEKYNMNELQNNEYKIDMEQYFYKSELYKNRKSILSRTYINDTMQKYILSFLKYDYHKRPLLSNIKKIED